MKSYKALWQITKKKMEYVMKTYELHNVFCEIL